MYAEGNTEAMIGEVLASLPAPQAALALLATKANPDEERGGDGTGGNLDGAFTIRASPAYTLPAGFQYWTNRA